MNLLAITLKNILHRKIRAGLTILGVGVSIAAFVALIGLTRSLEDTFKVTYKQRGTDIVIVERGAVDILSSQIDQKYIDTIRSNPNVSDVVAILCELYALKFKQYYLLYGWEPGSYLFQQIQVQGKYPSQPDQIVIGDMASKRLGKSIGDQLQVRNKKFLITGVFQSKSILEDAALVMPLDKLQELKRSAGKVTMFNVRLREGSDIEQVQQQLEKALPDIEAKNIQSFMSSNTPLFMVLGFTWAVSVVALLIVILGIVNTMTTSVLEQTRQIGILLAIGWSKAKIMVLVLYESVFLGFCGGVCGLVLGYAIMNSLVHTQRMQGLISVGPDLAFSLAVLAIASGLGLVSGVYPAIKAVSIEPIKVLRYE